MKLYIPKQTEPEIDALPSHPKKVKKWLDALPQANMGEMTRQVYTRLRQLNRENMPNKHRMENMEIFRAPCREIFNNLGKYFINRTLPLPEKSKKIVTLNQSLLQEMAHGYKIIVYEAANEIDKKIDEKMLSTAICRAIMYQSELLFRASKIYAEVPEGTWYDMHQMYPYAEIRGIQNLAVKDPEHPDSKTTIEEAYKHALLFTIARPTAMHQTDTERVYKKLYQWSALAKLGSQPDRNQIDILFCTRVGEDRAPSYLNQQDCETNGKVFTLDTSELIHSIQAQIDLEQDRQDEIKVGDELSIETLGALITSWGPCPKRRFNRARRDEKIVTAIGLPSIASVIRKGNISEKTETYSPKNDKLENFTLESIPDDLKSMHDGSSTYLTHTEIGQTQNDAWDNVAKGKVLTEAYVKEQRIAESKRELIHKKNETLNWEIVNISAGGYCLRWNSEATSRAQIGELIALREAAPSGGFEWRVGVIRWMQFSGKHGLEIGVQVISPKALSTKAQRYNRAKEAPFDCLVLPNIKPLNQPMTIILPAHAFKTGDRVKILMSENSKIGIVLDEKGEHTGSFTQFLFTNIDDAPKTKIVTSNKEEESSGKKDDFDEIWSSL